MPKRFFEGQRVMALRKGHMPVDKKHGTISAKVEGKNGEEYFVAYDYNNDDHGAWYVGDELESEVGNPE
jgi:hypothetical protein